MGLASIVPLSDTIRTITWLYVFFVLSLTWLRQIPIPIFVRQFAGLYMLFRFLWLIYVCLDSEFVNASLAFETISVISCFIVGGLLLLAVK